MIGIVLGGLFATAVFLYPAMQLKKRHKWPITTGLLMTLAGIGLVGIAIWGARLATGITSTLIVGGIALVFFAGLIVATIADLSDKKLDHPWHLFMLPPLLAIVVITGSSTFGYLGQQIQRNANTLTQQVDG